MQISVIDLSTNRSIRLEVEPHHTLGWVLETVVNGLGLPRNRPYSTIPQLAKAVDDSIRKLDSLGRIKRSLPSGSVGREEAQRLRRLLKNLEKKHSEGAIGEAVYAKPGGCIRGDV